MVVIGHIPVARIEHPLNGALFEAGERIDLRASAVSDSGAALLAATCKWTVSIKHDEHYHPLQDDIVGNTGEFLISRDGHEYSGEIVSGLLCLRLSAATLTEIPANALITQLHTGGRQCHN